MIEKQTRLKENVARQIEETHKRHAATCITICQEYFASKIKIDMFKVEDLNNRVSDN